jgi:hypothetical protein
VKVADLVVRSDLPTISATFRVHQPNKTSLHSRIAQVPIDSGFGPANTTADVVKGIDLPGKIAIVTGGYVGLGLETTKALLSAGATVIVPVRTPEKAAANLAPLTVETAPLDLLDPASIDAFAAAFIASGRPLNILISSTMPPLWRAPSFVILGDMKRSFPRTTSATSNSQLAFGPPSSKPMALASSLSLRSDIPSLMSGMTGTLNRENTIRGNRTDK